MKIRTLAILAILVFAVGSLMGAGYGTLIGIVETPPSIGDMITNVVSNEDSMIEKFIDKQEALHPDGLQSASIEVGSLYVAPPEGSIEIASTATYEPEETVPQSSEQEQSTEEQDNTEQDNTNSNGWGNLTSDQQLGQPTVSDGTPLRVRAEASATGSVIGQVYNTEQLLILDEQEEWYHILTAQGLEGYVSRQYMKVLP